MRAGSTELLTTYTMSLLFRSLPSQLAALHTAAHATAVLALGAGAVSFTHIVKAAEPVFTSGFSALILGQTFALPVYLSLIPVIAGVSLASLKELSFSWVAFGNAMGSNTASALRGIIGKKQMGKPVGDNMSPANLYAVLTVLAFIYLTPLALVIDGPRMTSAWSAALATGITAKKLSITMLLSGLFYYLYNEVAFLALDSVNPVTVRGSGGLALLDVKNCRFPETSFHLMRYPTAFDAGMRLASTVPSVIGPSQESHTVAPRCDGLFLGGVSSFKFSSV